MDWKDKRIGVLMGGMSTERKVSLASGEAVHAALADQGYDVCKVFLDRDLDLVLRQNNVQIVFNALHGRYGEDGCVQGLLELMGLPYTGSGVLSSAIAMDKVRTKEILRLYNLPTPPGYSIVSEQLEDLKRIHGHFGFPSVVKPVREGSSVGVMVARDFEELEYACEEAFNFDDRILIERYIDGVEVTIGVSGEGALAAMEIDSPSALFDYRSKYTPGTVEYHLPARLSAGRYQGVLTQAQLAYRALGCSGVARVDMLVSTDGNEFILEVNTLPGLSANCMIPKIAHYKGIAFIDLIERVLDEASLHGTAPGFTHLTLEDGPADLLANDSLAAKRASAH